MRNCLSITGLVFFLVSIVSCSNKKNETEEEYPLLEEEAVMEAPSESLEDIFAKHPEESFEERFESMNPWRKAYFKNEWDEDRPDKPYLYTTLSGTGWGIQISYESAESTNTLSGVFAIFITDEHGKTSMYGPVNILVRGSDDETKIMPVTEVHDGVAYIADPYVVEGFKEYLNSDQFDILLEFEKYNERHKTKAHWWSEPGFFKHAVETML